MSRRHPDRTQPQPSSRNCNMCAACPIGIGTKSSLVAYPAHAVGLEIRVASRESATLCTMRTGNWWGSVSLKAIWLLRCRTWRFRRLGIARLRGSIFAVRKYVLQDQLIMDNSDFSFVVAINCQRSFADIEARAGSPEGRRNHSKTPRV